MIATATLTNDGNDGPNSLYGLTRHPDVSEARLADLRVRLTQAGPALVVSISVLVSAVLIADGLLGLLGG